MPQSPEKHHGQQAEKLQNLSRQGREMTKIEALQRRTAIYAVNPCHSLQNLSTLQQLGQPYCPLRSVFTARLTFCFSKES
ncbi:MAG: hypothetical protein H7X92_10440 [Chitinophagales bacterium]|nr:hypothetical protein [Hyphomicrobiales bacterium]